MKRMKKILAMVMAMAMVLGMSLTTFAAPAETTPISKPEAGQSAAVKITGSTIKEDKVSFKVYQLIEPDFDTNKGFVGYKWLGTYTNGKSGMVSYDNAGNVNDLTAENVTTWAAAAPRTEEHNATVSWNQDGTVASITLEVGTWMILAQSIDDAAVVYNPMVASVYYVSQTSVGTDGVSADTTWNIATTDAYEKSTDMSNQEDKQVGELGAEGQISQANAYAQVGNSIPYVLKGLVPSYSLEYFTGNMAGSTTTRTVTYKLNDTIANGLQYNNDIKVYVGNTNNPIENKATDVKYSIAWLDENGNEITGADAYKTAKAFSVTLTSSYVQSLAGEGDVNRRVYVTYTANVTADAVSQVAENKFDVSYTRVPGEPAVDTTEKTVYSYTAAISGTFQKVDENDNALAGATFTLYSDSELKSVIGTATTVAGDANLIFKDSDNNVVGLEFEKTYYIKETASPNGYSINETVYEVKCSYAGNKGTFVKDDASGVDKLTAYTVSIKNPNVVDNPETTDIDESVKEIVVNYGGSATVLNGVEKVINTKLNSLPSTGGIGTTIFTLGGCAIMIIAAGLYFASRRKKNEE